MYEIMQCTSLKGNIRIQGAKNAVLPMLAAAILNKGITKLCRCPKITDVYIAIEILEYIGCSVIWDKDDIIIDASTAEKYEVPAYLLNKMRASVTFLGALLGRFGKALITYPGGCSIGERPINLHIDALKQLNVHIEEDGDNINAFTEGIIGAEITFPKISVGATENIMLAAVLGDGTTVMKNCAIEPEVNELAKLLNKMGAKIRITDGNVIIVQGVNALKKAKYKVCGDRIVAGTYMAAAALIGGRVRLKNINPRYLTKVIEIFKQIGCTVITGRNWIYIRRNPKKSLKPIPLIETDTFPGFPTDMQSQMAVLLTQSDGKSVIRETIFESRFKIVPELKNMQANIEIRDDDYLVIHGVSKLIGSNVTAYDLRGGAALVIAGLSAEGKTIISGEEFIKRGYEDIIGDLQRLGADLREIEA